MYDAIAEHNLDYSLCQNGVVVCLGYSEENLEAISTSLEVVMQSGDSTSLFFIGSISSRLLRTLNYGTFTKQMVFMHINDSDSLDGHGVLKIDIYIIFYAPNGVGHEVKILEKYRIGFGGFGNVVTRLLGTWTMADGFKIMNSSLWERRSDLFGIILRIGVLTRAPFLECVWDKNRKKIIGIKGSMVDIFSNLQNRLNLTTTLSIPEDGMYGTNKMIHRSGTDWWGC